MNYLLRTWLIASVLLTPSIGEAAELRLEVDKVNAYIGEMVIVRAFLHTSVPVNAVEGTLVYSADSAVLESIRDGNSSINFWIEKPNEVSPGKITFSGVTPGGILGGNNLLFFAIVELKKPGATTFSIEEATVLQNDGEGTEVPTALRNVVVSVSSEQGATTLDSVNDVDPPESFVPTIASDPNLFEGDYFLVFKTQDKGSGIVRYEVREGRWGWFKEAESPYRLTEQDLDKDIYVRAIDYEGNERLVFLPRENSSLWWEDASLLGLFAILGVLLMISVLSTRVWKRNSLQ